MDFAISRNDTSGDCICETGYTYSGGTINDCLRNCGDGFENGIKVGENNICDCQSGNEWDTTEDTCVIACNMEYAISRTPGVTDACVCH